MRGHQFGNLQARSPNFQFNWWDSWHILVSNFTSPDWDFKYLAKVNKNIIFTCWISSFIRPNKKCPSLWNSSVRVMWESESAVHRRGVVIIPTRNGIITILLMHWEKRKTYMGFPGGSAGRESAHNVGDLGWIPGLGDPLVKGKATHSSILA